MDARVHTGPVQPVGQIGRTEQLIPAARARLFQQRLDAVVLTHGPHQGGDVADPVREGQLFFIAERPEHHQKRLVLPDELNAVLFRGVVVLKIGPLFRGKERAGAVTFDDRLDEFARLLRGFLFGQQ